MIIATREIERFARWLDERVSTYSDGTFNVVIDEENRINLPTMERVVELYNSTEGKYPLEGTINHELVRRLGFKETTIRDDVYEAEYGIPYRIVKLKLHKKIHAYWEITDRSVTLMRIGKEGDVLSRQRIHDPATLLEITSFFGITPKPSKDDKGNEENTQEPVREADVREGSTERGTVPPDAIDKEEDATRPDTKPEAVKSEVLGKIENLDAFRKLIRKYESLSLEQVESTWIKKDSDAQDTMEELTGFGSPSTCTLCKVVRKDCDKCVYGTFGMLKGTPCIDGTYDDIENADSPEELMIAIANRVSYMKDILDRIERGEAC